MDWKDEILGGLADAAPAPLASMRHLRRFILIIIGIAVATFLQASPATAAAIASRIPLYLVLISVEILLVWFVAIGVHARGYRVHDLLGRCWRSPGDGCTDFILAIVTIAILRLCTRAVYLFFGHWPANIGFLLPRTSPESAIWIAVAITAGICEELVYRGYLQRQLWSLTKNLWWAIMLQAIVFGCIHLYQGWKPAVVTVLYGLVFGLFAVWRRSIIPGIIAHSIIDIVGGLFSR